ncbi:hypothetical protein ACA910_001164 [Epithemia clementina (nom. ined.)]
MVLLLLLPSFSNSVPTILENQPQDGGSSSLVENDDVLLAIQQDGNSATKNSFSTKSQAEVQEQAAPKVQDTQEREEMDEKTNYNHDEVVGKEDDDEENGPSRTKKREHSRQNWSGSSTKDEEIVAVEPWRRSLQTDAADSTSPMEEELSTQLPISEWPTASSPTSPPPPRPVLSQWPSTADWPETYGPTPSTSPSRTLGVTPSPRPFFSSGTEWPETFWPTASITPTTTSTPRTTKWPTTGDWPETTTQWPSTSSIYPTSWRGQWPSSQWPDTSWPSSVWPIPTPRPTVVVPSWTQAPTTLEALMPTFDCPSHDDSSNNTNKAVSFRNFTYHFNAQDETFPFNGATSSIKIHLGYYNRNCYRAVLFNISDVNITGDFDETSSSSEHFTAQVVNDASNHYNQRYTIVDNRNNGFQYNDCENHIMEANQTFLPLELNPMEDYLNVEMTTGYGVDNYCHSESQVEFNVTIGYVLYVPPPTLAPTQSAAPSLTPAPSTFDSTCRDVVVEFDFDNNRNQTFPFLGYSINITKTVAFPQYCKFPAIVAVSDVQFSGDFDSTSETFSARFVGHLFETIVDTNGQSWNNACYNNSVAPIASLPLFPGTTGDGKIELTVQLQTSSAVDNLCSGNVSFVRFNVTIGMVEAPSAAPSISSNPTQTPSISANPSGSPSEWPSFVPSVPPSDQPSPTPSVSLNPTVSLVPSTVPSDAPSQSPSTICENEPKRFVQYRFDSGNNTYPEYGSFYTITKDIDLGTPFGCDAYISETSNISYLGNFASTSEYFLLQLVNDNNTSRALIAKGPMGSQERCTENQTSPADLFSVVLDVSEKSLSVLMAITSSVGLCYYPYSFLELNMTISFRTGDTSRTPKPSEAPSSFPSELPTISQIPSSSVAPTTATQSPAASSTCGALPPQTLSFLFTATNGTFPISGGSYTITKRITSAYWCDAIITSVSNAGYMGNFRYFDAAFALHFGVGESKMLVAKSSATPESDCVYNETEPVYIDLPVLLEFQDSLSVALSTTPSVYGSYCYDDSYVSLNVTLKFIPRGDVKSQAPSVEPSQRPTSEPTVSSPPTTSSVPTWSPTQARAPAKTPVPTKSLAPSGTSSPPIFSSRCGVILRFDFNSTKQAFPFIGSPINMTGNIAFPEYCINPAIVSISKVQFSGDFDSSSEYFSARFVGAVNGTIVDTKGEFFDACSLFELPPNASLHLPMLLEPQVTQLTVQLQTSSAVDNLCPEDVTFVRFDVFIDSLEEPSMAPSISPRPTQFPTVSTNPSEPPSDAPSTVPSVKPSNIPSQAPTLSMSPTVSLAPSAVPSGAPSQSPSTICENEPKIFLQYRFDGGNNTYPGYGSFYTITKDIDLGTPFGCDAYISETSNISYLGDFASTSEYFLLQLVNDNNTSRALIAKGPMGSQERCTENQTSPADLSSVVLDVSEKSLSVLMAITSSASWCDYPYSFLELNMTISFRTGDPTRTPKPSGSPTLAPTQLPVIIPPSAAPTPLSSQSQCSGLASQVLSFDFRSTNSSFPSSGSAYTITKSFTSAYWCDAVVMYVSKVGYFGNFMSTNEAFALQFGVGDSKILVAKSPPATERNCAYNETEPTYIKLPLVLELQDSLSAELATTPYVTDSYCPDSYVSLNVTLKFVPRSGEVPSGAPSISPSEHPSQIPTRSVAPSVMPSENPTSTPTASLQPTVSSAPSWSPSQSPSQQPTSNCVNIPDPIVVNFDFNSKNGTLPFGSSYVLTKALDFDARCFSPLLMGISEVNVNGDFNDPSEYLSLGLVGRNGDTTPILDTTRNTSNLRQCINETIQPTIYLPRPISGDDSILSFRLSTGSAVDNFCYPSSFVQFSVTIGFADKMTGLPPPPQVFDFDFNSRDGTFQFFGSSTTISQALPSYDERSYTPAVVAISDVQAQGDFDAASSSEYFLIELVDGGTFRSTFVDSRNNGRLLGFCSNETLAASGAALPYLLSSGDTMLTFMLTTSSEVDNLCNDPFSFVRFSVTVHFLWRGGTTVPSPSPQPSSVGDLLPSGPSSQPGPSCEMLPSLLLDFVFDSRQATFPFRGNSSTITKQLSPYNEDCCIAVITSISNIEINGDFNDPSKTFILRFVGENAPVGEIANSNWNNPLQSSCVHHTTNARMAISTVLEGGQNGLSVQLITSNNVKESCPSYVKFSMIVDFQLAQTPNPAPRFEVPNSCYALEPTMPPIGREVPPSLNPPPSSSLSCEDSPRPPTQPLVFDFNSQHDTFPLILSQSTITRTLPSYNEACFSPAIVAVSDIQLQLDWNRVDGLIIELFTGSGENGNAEKTAVVFDTSILPLAEVVLLEAGSNCRTGTRKVSPGLALPILAKPDIQDDSFPAVSAQLSSTLNSNVSTRWQSCKGNVPSFIRFTATVEFLPKTTTSESKAASSSARQERPMLPPKRLSTFFSYPAGAATDGFMNTMWWLAASSVPLFLLL